MSLEQIINFKDVLDIHYKIETANTMSMDTETYIKSSNISTVFPTDIKKTCICICEAEKQREDAKD